MQAVREQAMEAWVFPDHEEAPSNDHGNDVRGSVARTSKHRRAGFREFRYTGTHRVQRMPT